jgi:serine/threonine protein kinase
MELAGYILDECIGSGSSGDVWRAHFEEAIVAIKIMQKPLLKSKRQKLHLRRFRREIEALRLLALVPQVPDLFEAYQNTVPPFFIMSFVEGHSFADDIASGQMMIRPVQERLERLHTIASALDAVHEAGLLHRDIKPANIRGWGKPFLLDFSIVLPINAAKSANPRIGTQAYLPPYHDFSPNIFTDIYGFALLCYEVLFGRHALFSLGEIGQDLRETALEKLTHRTWYRPSLMSEVELPIYLRGADLLALDDIFQQALTTQNDFMSAKAIVSALQDAIVVPENELYLEQIPKLRPLTDSDAFRSETFTNHEVDGQAFHTELEGHIRIFSKKASLAGMSIIGFLVLLAWLVLRYL